MILMTVLLLVLSSCAMQAGKYTSTPTANIPTGRNFEQQFLRKINALRASGCNCGKTYMRPAPPLKWDSRLEKAAINHARDMDKNNYLSHTNSRGHGIKQRIEAAGYKLTGSMAYSYGENIATGQRSIDRVMQSWIKSEGHCKNLMNPTFKDIGIAQINYYWVQEFAMRKPYDAVSSSSGK